MTRRTGGTGQDDLCKWLGKNSSIILINGFDNLWIFQFWILIWWERDSGTLLCCIDITNERSHFSLHSVSSLHLSLPSFPTQLFITIIPPLCEVRLSQKVSFRSSWLEVSNSRTAHPASPHKPPSNINVSQAEVAEFQRSGYLVIRNVLPSHVIRYLNQASADLRTNKTLHCQMSYYNSPPIFHKENIHYKVTY